MIFHKQHLVTLMEWNWFQLSSCWIGCVKLSMVFWPGLKDSFWERWCIDKLHRGRIEKQFGKSRDCIYLKLVIVSRFKFNGRVVTRSTYLLNGVGFGPTSSRIDAVFLHQMCGYCYDLTMTTSGAQTTSVQCSFKWRLIVVLGLGRVFPSPI